MSTLYLKGLEVALDALMNEAAAPSGTPKLAFMSTGYTPDAGTDQFWSDISASQASGTSSITLTNVDVRIDSGNARVEVDADNVSTSDITASTDKFVVYIDTGTASTSPLVVALDINEGTLNPVSGTLAVNFNVEGMFALNAT